LAYAFTVPVTLTLAVAVALAYAFTVPVTLAYTIPWRRRVPWRRRFGDGHSGVRQPVGGNQGERVAARVCVSETVLGGTTVAVRLRGSQPAKPLTQAAP
jgi:hypothetical protein